MHLQYTMKTALFTLQ